MQPEERIRALRMERGMTQEDLAKLIGVSVISVRKWESGKSRPQWEFIIRLANLFHISADSLLGTNSATDDMRVLLPQELALLTGFRGLDIYGKEVVTAVCEAERRRVKKTSQIRRNDTMQFAAAKKNGKWLPYFPISAAAGITTDLGNMESEMRFAEGDVPEQADFFVTISGESMQPYIHDGDDVFIQSDAQLRNGDVGIFCVDGGMVCKQYFHDSEGNTILVSANPELRYSNIVLSKDSDVSVRFCGKVLLPQKVPFPDYLFED